jgi:hypothetical protein
MKNEVEDNVQVHRSHRAKENVYKTIAKWLSQPFIKGLAMKNRGTFLRLLIFKDELINWINHANEQQKFNLMATGKIVKKFCFWS